MQISLKNISSNGRIYKELWTILTSIQTAIEGSYKVKARRIDQSNMIACVELSLVHQHTTYPLCLLVKLYTR